MSQQTDRGGLRPAEAYDSQKKFTAETLFVKITGSLGSLRRFGGARDVVTSGKFVSQQRGLNCTDVPGGTGRE